MKGFQRYLLIHIIGYHAHEHTRRKVGNGRGRNSQLQLFGSAHRSVRAVGGKGGALLQDFAKAFRELFGGVAHHLAGDHIAYNVQNHIRLFAAIIFPELAGILYR